MRFLPYCPVLIHSFSLNNKKWKQQKNNNKTNWNEFLHNLFEKELNLIFWYIEILLFFKIIIILWSLIIFMMVILESFVVTISWWSVMGGTVSTTYRFHPCPTGLVSLGDEMAHLLLLRSKTGKKGQKHRTPRKSGKSSAGVLPSNPKHFQRSVSSPNISTWKLSASCLVLI